MVVFFFSGAPTSLYVKAAGYAPPTPEAALVIPVVALMMINMMLRIRATLTGAVALWAWLSIAVLAVISFKWSVSPIDTIREASLMLIVVVYIGMAAGIMDWIDILKRLWAVSLFLIVLSFLLYIAVPSIGRMQEVYAGAMTGPWHEKNATGQFFLWSGLVNIALTFAKPSRVVFAGVMAIIIGIGLVMTASTTALLTYILVTGVSVLVAIFRRSFVISFPVGLLLVCLIVPIAFFITTEAEAILGALGKSGTLTGRLPIWQSLQDFPLRERPLLGHGYGAYWMDEYEYTSRARIFEALDFRVSNSHNAFLEARLDLGWVGAGLWLIAVIQLIAVSLLRMRSSSGAYLAVPYILGMPLIAFVEASAFTIGNFTWLYFVLITAKMTLHPSRNDRVSGGWQYLKKIGVQSQPAVFTPYPHAVTRAGVY